MTEHFVDLTNGERIPVKVNFGTIYYLQKTRGYHKLVKKSKEKNLTESEAMDMAAMIIYAVLRSNGKQVSFDEALQLTPPDGDSINEMLTGFKEDYEKYTKKKQAKSMMNQVN